jgi:hypothetical protein
MTVSAKTSVITEADVETQVVLPLLTLDERLGIPIASIKSKEFLSAQDIGKGAKKRSGYIPDFCVYVMAVPVLVVEVKSPRVDVAEAWDEAALYAHALNRVYPMGTNPCQRLFATNGTEFLAGPWDSTPACGGLISDLVTGAESLAALQAQLAFTELEKIAELVSIQLKFRGFKRPSSQGNGSTLINSKLEPNTFAADLSPILRRYFSSRDQNKDPEIYKNAYVSSNEVTSYDRVLESFLKDRLIKSRARTEVVTTKRKADTVSQRITEFAKSRPQSGDLLLVTGGVGAGKSLFARRYKEFLQPGEIAEKSHWAFLDFNTAPDDLSKANEWVCGAFVTSLIEEGAPFDPRDAADQERIFADNIRDRSSYYHRVEARDPSKGDLERARDIEGWRQDNMQLAPGVSRYLQGDRGDNLIAVFDNVDRRDAPNQLAAFQTALWFMNLTRCLVILQMRDVTFEAFKNDKPLDAYRTGQVFYISPPRFVDVVKRRLELSLSALAEEAPDTVRYKTPTGVNISYPKSRAGEFLKGIYLELFQRPTNVSRVLEALAGRNVRKALDMFMAIINSGHMPEDLITVVASGYQLRTFPEYLVLRILMRRDYRYFSDDSGFVSNVFFCDTNAKRPSNFIIIEILFLLIGRRKIRGDNGQLGFVALHQLQDELEAMGFVRSDVHEAAQYALKRELLEADSSAISLLTKDDCIKATASGWAHMRLLAGRLEYLSAIMPTTAFNDDRLAARVYDLMQTENRYGSLRVTQSLGVVEDLYRYLSAQHDALRTHVGYAQKEKTGAKYVLGKIAEAINYTKKAEQGDQQLDWLDT